MSDFDSLSEQGDPDQDEMMAAFGITPTKRSNSVIGKVESVAPTKSGKALRVKVAGNYYNAFLDSGLDKAVGQTIDFEVSPDKGYGPGIGKWGAAQAEQAPASRPSPANSPTGASGDRFYMPFVSNVVAHAIAAGRIQDPQALNAWAKAAYDAAQALDTL